MRIHNFSAGPAALPLPVLERAQAELTDYAGSGMSVMEMSHRSATFIEIAARAERDARALLAIPENYRVLFLQGGATAQFAAVPLNLLGERASADYVHTGAWSAKAIKEMARYGQANVIASAEGTGFDRVPAPASWQRDPEAAYLHLCSNETIGGVQFSDFPEDLTLEGVPLVVDMSSDIMSRPLPIERFGLIYAGAQKNIGPAGLTLVIVRDDLLDRAAAATPSVLDYRVQADADSMSNTPPTYAWYLAGLVFQWLLEQGGLTAVEVANRRKAEALYGLIDASNFFHSPVESGSRSLMNIPFTLPDAALDAPFLVGAERAGLMNLKGHRSVGGMRASLYNAVSDEAVAALCQYMQDFEREHR
ncbi:MAG: 3-phosphoserine/phosphohydroxythreonine transaminase [Pseudomonadota bacterium]